MSPVNPIAWIKAVALAAKWPFKVMLIVFLLSAALLTPWAARIPGYAVIGDHLIWVAIVCAFSGLFILFTGLECLRGMLGKPVEEWRKGRVMDAKIRGLDADEILVLSKYADSGEARQYITEENKSAVRSLIDKGIVTPAGEITGYWLDRLAFDLTPDANKSIRKPAIRSYLKQGMG